MESIWKSFSLGFLLRSIFAGVFFFISFSLTEKNNLLFNSDDVQGSMVIILTVSLFAGVIVYGLHRALLYALLIEPVLNSEGCERIRKYSPLISQRTMDSLLSVWDMEDEKSEKNSLRSKKMIPWGDYTHLHYTACWSVIAGAIAYICMDGSHFERYKINPTLCWLSLIFFTAGVVSDWRLKSLREYIEGQKSVSSIPEQNVPNSTGE